MTKKTRTDYKQITIWLPVWVWIKLRTPDKDGNLKSMQQTVVDLLIKYIK